MKPMFLAPSPRVVILVATDGSPASNEAMAAAGRFAALPGSELHVVHVLDPQEVVQEGAIAACLTMLERAIEAHGLASTATLHITAGIPWREVVQLGADVHADVIVVGSHGRSGLGRLLLGSVSEQIVAKAGCAVFVARSKDTAAAAPEIEPPCPDCVAVQASSRGERLWCERHSNRHVRARLHYELAKGFGAGSQLLR